MKKTVTVVAVLLLIGIIIYFQRSSLETNKVNSSQTNKKKVTVYQRIIENNTDKSSYKPYEIEEEKTSLDLLQKSSSVTMKGSGENAFVTTINGIEASEKKKTYWAFYINDKLAEVGVGSYKLVNGDKIQWKLENY